MANWLLARDGDVCCVILVHSTWQNGLSRCLSSVAVSGNAAVEEWRGLRIYWYGEDICGPCNARKCDSEAFLKGVVVMRASERKASIVGVLNDVCLDQPTQLVTFTNMSPIPSPRPSVVTSQAPTHVTDRSMRTTNLFHIAFHGVRLASAARYLFVLASNTLSNTSHPLCHDLAGSYSR